MIRIRHGVCLCVLAAVFCVVGAANAGQFWVAYEGDDYPENQGWQRACGNEQGDDDDKYGANRSLDNGIFILDSLSNYHIYDFYRTKRTIDPGPGEMFVAEWRVLIDPRSDPRDVGVYIFRALSPGHTYFKFGPNSVYIEPGDITIGLEEGVFHSYRFESRDMQSFALSIDDTITLDGYFNDNSVLQYYVTFGDGVQGECSLSQWDYFRYGIVPEPAAATSVLCFTTCLLTTRHIRSARV